MNRPCTSRKGSTCRGWPLALTLMRPHPRPYPQVEHLALMERTLGALPRHMLRSATCKRADRNFRHGYLRWPERAIDRGSEEHVRSQRRLKDTLSCDPRGEPLRWTDELSDFHDLLLRLLEFRPELRLSAQAALQHPFVLRGRKSNAAPNPERPGAVPALSTPSERPAAVAHNGVADGADPVTDSRDPISQGAGVGPETVLATVADPSQTSGGAPVPVGGSAAAGGGGGSGGGGSDES